jgi:hypothetical protein
MEPDQNALTAEQELGIDYAETAVIGTTAFQNPRITFSGDHLKWFYEKSFSLGSTVIALRSGGKKVGQIAMVKQTVMMDGQEEDAAQLVDLFIDKAHRGKRALTLLFAEVEKQFKAQDIRFAFGMPNVKAVHINELFFQLKPLLSLNVRIGCSLPFTARKANTSFRFSQQLKEEVVALGNRFATPKNENGLKWDGEKIFNRLSANKFEYALHATENLMVISSPRERRGVPFTLLCGFFRNAVSAVTTADIHSVTRSACATWGRPVFIYAGHYVALPELPGFALPKTARRSPMLLQARDFHSGRSPFSMDRFQLIDCDFA